MGFNRVVTHNDFDGVVCAALCSHVYGMETIFFTGPRDIANSRFPIGKADIVCDLPYPLECGMWIDHHPGNLEDVKLRGIDPETIPGRFSPEPSAARAAWNLFSEEWELAEHLEGTVAEADVIDAFDFKTIEEWRAPTPGKRVDASIKAPAADRREKLRYLRRLALWLRDCPLEQVQDFKEVAEKRELFEEEERKSLEIIRRSVIFLPEDVERRVPIIDITGYRQRPNVIRNIAYLEHPQAHAAMMIGNPTIDGRKSTNLSLSMSLSFVLNNFDHGKDVGEILRSLNIGDGHAGAGAGSLECKGKEEMLKAKESVLRQILGAFLAQPLGGEVAADESGAHRKSIDYEDAETD